jgi:hypothetical protein
VEVPRAALGLGGGHGKHGVHHQVHRDDVRDAFRDPGKFRDRAAAEGEDDRFGHLEAVDPSGIGMLERALDDRRAHDRQRQAGFGRDLLGGPFAQRLGERVHVRPAQGLRPGSSVLNEALVHPILAPFLGCRRDRHRAGPFVLGPGLRHEPVKHLGLARGFLDGRSGTEGGVGFGPPVHTMGQRLLGDDALLRPRHVRRRHVHQVRPAAAPGNRFVEPHRAQDVRSEGLIDWRIERDRRRAVKHHAQVGREVGDVVRNVTLDDRDSVLDCLLQTIQTVPLAKRPERGATEHLLDAGPSGASEPWAHQDRDRRIGEIGKEAFEQGGAEKSRDAGDEDTRVAKRFANRSPVPSPGLYHAVDYGPGFRERASSIRAEKALKTELPESEDSSSSSAFIPLPGSGCQIANELLSLSF